MPDREREMVEPTPEPKEEPSHPKIPFPQKDTDFDYDPRDHDPKWDEGDPTANYD
jgi:hypothetical protein